MRRLAKHAFELAESCLSLILHEECRLTEHTLGGLSYHSLWIHQTEKPHLPIHW